MILPKSERNNDVEKSTELGSQYSFPIKGTRLLGEIADYSAQRRNIEEESGDLIVSEGKWKKKKKKKAHSNGLMSKKTVMSF